MRSVTRRGKNESHRSVHCHFGSSMRHPESSAPFRRSPQAQAPRSPMDGAGDLAFEPEHVRQAIAVSKRRLSPITSTSIGRSVAPRFGGGGCATRRRAWGACSCRGTPTAHAPMRRCRWNATRVPPVGQPDSGQRGTREPATRLHRVSGCGSGGAHTPSTQRPYLGLAVPLAPAVRRGGSGSRRRSMGHQQSCRRAALQPCVACPEIRS